MPLTDTQIKAIKPEAKPRKLADEKGLYLLVQPTGAKLWRFKYRFGGKEKLLALGSYPDVGLKDARNKRDEVRKLLADGVDPGEQRKAQKAASELRAANSFEVICREWLVAHHSGAFPVPKSLGPARKECLPVAGRPPDCRGHGP